MPPVRPARIERDSMGEIAVPEGSLWGAQTQRSLQNFAIAHDLMPRPLIHAYGHIKLAAARVNEAKGLLPGSIANAIQKAAREVAVGEHDTQFPLSVWQTGSGTQTNMNVNEVIANRASELLGSRVHPNDHVNRSQSSNDTFPTAMHVAAVGRITAFLLPEVEAFHSVLARQSAEWSEVVKIGRTHLQDAVPMTVGQEWSGYAALVQRARERIKTTLPGLCELAVGGSAVGTGLNTPPGFGEAVAAELSELLDQPFTSAPNKFAALSGNDAMLSAMGELRGLAASLIKIANDIRWLASGPRCGLGELILPANEPGSSIMPGKVNPTQAEALIMACYQVFAADTAVALAGAHGNLELNVLRPLMIYNLLHAVDLLGGACRGFRTHCLEGIVLDKRRIASYLERSLMLVTALTPAIGYDAAARLAHLAHERDLSLREANRILKVLPEEEFERLLRPAKMV